MANKSLAHVVIIGGGATGLGIARDAALRGFKVSLFERGELGAGTTSYSHRVLHSGVRYAMADPIAAEKCYRESQTLLKMARGAVQPRQALCVALNQHDAEVADDYLRACRAAGIDIAELDPKAVLASEPSLNSSLVRAFGVQEGHIDAPRLLELNKRAAERADIPAEIYPNHPVVGITVKGNRVASVKVQDKQNGENREVACDFVINAAGVWGGQVAGLIGVGIPFSPDKGSMVVFNKVYTKATLHRIRQRPGSGDILIDDGQGSNLGTTSRPTTDLDTHEVTQEEIDELLREGRLMVPSLDASHIAYTYAGVRPLYSGDQSSGRGATRSFQILNHQTDGVNNFVSVVGGKLTIYRLMAESAVDAMCQQLGIQAKSTTATTPLHD